MATSMDADSGDRNVTDVSAEPFISIDQNSHSLWDTLPKLIALVRSGRRGRHLVEDVDVAFTRHGAAAGDGGLALMPERMYRGGVSDWGAALFYSDFLGRQPFDLRRLEPCTGRSTAALARRLELSVDALYDRWSLSDNWQLVGPSYAAGDPRWHRTIGDLRTTEAAPFLRELLEHARHDMIQCFPEAAARRRIGDWIAEERAKLDALLDRHAAGRLVHVYADWLRLFLGDAVTVSMTSGFLDIAEPDAPAQRLLDLFLHDYERSAEWYNDAIVAGGVGLNPLRRDAGELPFFVVRRDGENLLRAPAHVRDSVLQAAELSWPLVARAGRPALPLAAMRRDGIVCVPGKALLLVLQARLQPAGGALALPAGGSVYMPAAHALEARLRDSGLLSIPAWPVQRVAFDFIARWRDCPTLIRLPEYLRDGLAADELSAAALAEELPAAVAQAHRHLQALDTEDGRQRRIAQLRPELTSRREALEHRRRQLASTTEGRPEAGRLWDEIKELDRSLLIAFVDWLVRTFQLGDVGYYKSRGALLPWSVALGGHAFFERVVRGADIADELPAAHGGGA